MWGLTAGICLLIWGYKIFFRREPHFCWALQLSFFVTQLIRAPVKYSSPIMSLGLKGKVTYWLQGFSHWQGIYYTIQKPVFLQNWPEPEPENLELPNRDNGRIDSWIETNPIILSVGEEGNCCAHQSRWVTEFGAQRVKIPLEHRLASFHALGGKCRCNLRVNVWLLIEYKGADGST